MAEAFSDGRKRWFRACSAIAIVADALCSVARDVGEHIHNEIYEHHFCTGDIPLGCAQLGQPKAEQYLQLWQHEKLSLSEAMVCAVRKAFCEDVPLHRALRNTLTYVNVKTSETRTVTQRARASTGASAAPRRTQGRDVQVLC